MPMNIRKNVDLKGMIYSKGLSQREFAERIGVSRRTIYSITGRDSTPSPKLAFKIERALGVEHGNIFFAQSGSKMTRKKEAS